MSRWKRRWTELETRIRFYHWSGLQRRQVRQPAESSVQKRKSKTGRAALVIVAGDASENTKKKFRDMCEFYKVPIYFYGDKDTLGHAMGKEFRASLAILDEGFAEGNYEADEDRR